MCIRREGGKLALDKAALEAEHPAVQKQLVKQCIARMLGTEKDIAAVHVRAVLDLLDKQSGRMTDLPGGIRAVRTGGGDPVRQTAGRGSGPGARGRYGASDPGRYHPVCPAVRAQAPDIVQDHRAKKGDAASGYPAKKLHETDGL